MGALFHPSGQLTDRTEGPRSGTDGRLAEWDRSCGTGRSQRYYDTTYAALAEPSVVDPMVDLLTQIVGDGPALEFAIGTGRVALALSVAGDPGSRHRALGEHGGAAPIQARRRHDLRDGRGHDDDSVTASIETVYLVANSIMNVTTQEEQIAVLSNAAAHLVSGGHFVIESMVPRVPLSEDARVFRLEPHHVGIETFSTTSSARWHGLTTGSRSKVAWCVIPLRTGISGRPSWS